MATSYIRQLNTCIMHIYGRLIEGLFDLKYKGLLPTITQ